MGLRRLAGLKCFLTQISMLKKCLPAQKSVLRGLPVARSQRFHLTPNAFWDTNTKMADEHEKECLEKLSKKELVEKIIQLQKEKGIRLTSIAGIPSNGESSCSGNDLSENPIEKRNKSKEKKSSKREFDFKRYNKRHIALMIAYLGWDMHGLASQENINTTVEAFLFDALMKAKLVKTREECNYSRCGRTDKGVSAFRQVVSLDVRSNLSEGAGVIQSKEVTEEKGTDTKELPYVQILNNLLPDEVRVISWAPVSPAFNARFSCTYRKYKYFFPAAGLNIDLMNTAAKKLEGEHDFRNFCKMDVANGVMQFKRTINSFVVKKIQGNTIENTEQRECLEDGYQMCEAVICGSAFLWHQVRCMMSILLMIGQQLEEPEVIDWLLDARNCPQRPQYNMAVEFPLVLFDCVFDDIQWIYEPSVIQSLNRHLQQLWTVHGVRATMLKELINVNIAPMHSTAPGDFDSGHHLSAFLIPAENNKTHKPLIKRAFCESFEHKLENVNSKRKKKGKDLLKSEKK